VRYLRVLYVQEEKIPDAYVVKNGCLRAEVAMHRLERYLRIS
jgi:hypothetical protein